MKPRILLLLCLALLVSGAVPLGTSGQAGTVPNVGLGFGPSNIQPISLGTPIYTQGDNIWLDSYYNATIEVALITPQGVDRTGVVLVEPGQLFQLYSFQSSDPSGSWTLSVITPLGLTVTVVTVVPPDNSLQPAFSGSHLNRNNLNQTFALPSTDAYDIQLCTVGRSIGHSLGFGLAGGLNGTMVVSLDGNDSRFTFTGIGSPLSAWLELYSQYSYGTEGGGTVSRSLLVADTPAISASPPSASTQVSLVQEMPMRQGRFDLRVFDRTKAGLALHDSQFLRTVNGTWVALGGCTASQSALSSSLSLVTNLDTPNSTWPRQLFTMYSKDGVESYSEIAVPGGEAAIYFRDSPGQDPLTGVVITPSAPGLAASDWAATNSSVYLLTGGLQTTVKVNLTFAKITSTLFDVQISGPYSAKTLSVPAGTLAVSAVQQGKTLPNSTITAAARGSQPVTLKPNAAGIASVLLPPGEYTVTAAFGGVSSNMSVAVSPGHVSSVSLDLTQQSVPVVLYLLVALGVAGIVANLFLWRQYLVRRKVYG